MYIGGIGKDTIGATMKEKTKAAGVEGNFYEDTETQTGCCACVVAGQERTLCVNLGAAKKYPTSHLEANLSCLGNASFIYTTGFFLDSNKEAFTKVCTYAAENDKPLGMNLSAVFIIDVYLQDVKDLLKYPDYVFCNEDESSRLAKALGLEESDRQGVAKMVAGWDKVNTKRPRTVIMTQGPEPTIVATSAGNGAEVTLELIEVPAVEKDKIVDTNGCGDAFVAAFVGSITKGKTIQ